MLCRGRFAEQLLQKPALAEKSPVALSGSLCLNAPRVQLRKFHFFHIARTQEFTSETPMPDGRVFKIYVPRISCGYLIVDRKNSTCPNVSFEISQALRVHSARSPIKRVFQKDLWADEAGPQAWVPRRSTHVLRNLRNLKQAVWIPQTWSLRRPQKPDTKSPNLLARKIV